MGSSDSPSLVDLVRLGRLEEVERTLRRPYQEIDANFAFQIACEVGNAKLAKALVGACSVVSSSRGLRKSAWGSSAQCMAIAAGRLDAEGFRDSYDVALALRDVDASTREGADCCALLLERSLPGESSWALREHVLSGAWARASSLLLAGAHWEAQPFYPMDNGNARRRFRLAMEEQVGEPSPKACWAWVSAEEMQAGGEVGRGYRSARLEAKDVAQNLDKIAFEKVVAWVEAGRVSEPSSLVLPPGKKVRL